MHETKWYKILSFLHLIFVLSIVLLGIVLLTGTILLIPALCAAFSIGKELLDGTFDVYDGLTRKFFGGLKHYMRSLRFFPVQSIIILQLTGILLLRGQQYFYVQVAMLVIAGLALTYLTYLCTYIVFIQESIRCEEVLVRMFRQVGMMLSLFILMILLTIFFNPGIIPILLIAGALPLLAIEAAVYDTIRKQEEKEV